MTAPPADSEYTYPHFRANSNIQASALVDGETLLATPQPFPQYSGVQILTDPAGFDPTDPKLHNNPVMGSPNLPVFIKLTKDPESRFMKILHILQIVPGIIFIFFIIGILMSQLTSESAFGGAIGNSVGSHHQIVLSTSVGFADVQGCDEVKAQLVQVVDFLKNPSKYERYGATMPCGYLLEGPPGVGKTLLAKAVAGEAGVPFIVISGAEFDEVYVGVGASRVRALFNEARKHRKAVIFIDEIDAVAGKRGETERGGSNRQTLNQLLVEMDGFKSNSGVIVLGATNTVRSLDPALLRPGRFDKTLTILPPDIAGRKQILSQLLSKISNEMLGKDIDADALAATTIGYTGADLANLINQAKLIAATDGSAGVISKEHLNKAKSFIDLGPERHIVLSKDDKERVAYHEAGHAVVGMSNPLHDPVLHATIVPHSRSLGLVLSGPEKDQVFISKAKLEARIDTALGGFIAEEIQYGAENVSTGPSSDLASVNQLARYMVNSGFGKRSGFLQIHDAAFEASETAKRNFEADVQDILNESRARVSKILTEKQSAWHGIARALMENESLNRKELEAIYNNPTLITASSNQVLKAKKRKSKNSSSDSV